MLIRTLELSDGTEIKRINRAAFAGSPWFENLSEQEVSKRWETQIAYTGFAGLVSQIDKKIAGAIWWSEITQEELKTERGEPLALFAKDHLSANCRLIWERELVVDPAYQGKKIGTALRSAFVKKIKDLGTVLILTRMRDDNYSSIKTGEKIGLKPTGIKVPSSQVKGLFHEYWYLLVNNGPQIY